MKLTTPIVALGLIWAVTVSAQYRMPELGNQGALPANVRPAQLVGVGVEEHLGTEVDPGLVFTGEDGYPVTLGRFLNQGRPVILNLVYYNCPMLCTLLLNGQTEAMRNIPWTPGKDYDVVTISIDPRESFADARRKKAVYLSSYERPAPGWHFLSDHPAPLGMKDATDGDVTSNAKRLAAQVGFNYRYDSSIEQYAHPAAIMILTPQGRVARYLYGLRFSPRDLRFALAEASQGRSTMALEKVLLFCYHYDPKAKGYVLFAQNLMRVGGVVTLVVLLTFLRFMFRAERLRTARIAQEGYTKEGYA
jgi:protein SCO1/2